VSLGFEWDPAKAAEKLRKHDVSFEEAETAFRDLPFQPPSTISGTLPMRSVSVLFGTSEGGRLLAVMHTFREDTVRIISARAATGSERRERRREFYDELGF
jgi:uncharacterized protein